MVVKIKKKRLMHFDPDVRVFILSHWHKIQLYNFTSDNFSSVIFICLTPFSQLQLRARVRLHVTEIKSHPGWKNFFLQVSFIPGWHLIWKKTSHWVWKHIIKFIILAWHVKISDDYFFRQANLFIIFVCLFSY